MNKQNKFCCMYIQCYWYKYNNIPAQNAIIIYDMFYNYLYNLMYSTILQFLHNNITMIVMTKSVIRINITGKNSLVKYHM